MIYTYYTSIIYGFTMDPHKDQLPVALIAQLVEHCRSILSAEGEKYNFLSTGLIEKVAFSVLNLLLLLRMLGAFLRNVQKFDRSMVLWL